MLSALQDLRVINKGGTAIHRSPFVTIFIDGYEGFFIFEIQHENTLANQNRRKP